ncbi:hypothetical protein K0M31_011460 [Melipona bicolor]|uniref:Uncharacterized protein n=1 Tax=Melipona bicolor TaxID=60889 RepID=A0AA40G9S8_9HYME|nr:hypothetical protein K0M31_011460 [Melipona bicolor]
MSCDLEDRQKKLQLFPIVLNCRKLEREEDSGITESALPPQQLPRLFPNKPQIPQSVTKFRLRGIKERCESRNRAELGITDDSDCRMLLGVAMPAMGLA